MIYCSHREIFKRRPGWRDPIAPDCPGKLVIAPETEGDEVWVAVCDVCMLEVGIPPREQKRWLDAQGVL